MILEECRRVILDPKSSVAAIQRHFVLFMVVAYGIRCKAVCHLRPQDIDLAERTLYIHRTKGDKSRTIFMDVPIDDIWPRVVVTRERLIQEILERHGDLPGVADRLQCVPWLFFTKVERSEKSVGHQLRRCSVSSTVCYLTKRIVGRRISPHAFRHAKVFTLLDRGWKIERVAAYMGHNSIQTTFQYVHLGPAEMRAEVERVAGVDNPESGKGPSQTDSSGAAVHLKSLFDQGLLSKDEYLSKMETILGVL